MSLDEEPPRDLPGPIVGLLMLICLGIVGLAFHFAAEAWYYAL